MAITYPVAFPTLRAPVQVTLTQQNVVAVDQSEFTLQHQVQEFSGQAWRASFNMPPMVRADFETWAAFLSSLKGQRGTFLLGLANCMRGYALLGAGGGTHLVKGAGQTGESLDTDGWPNSTLVLKAGDYFGLGTTDATRRFFKVLKDVTSDGSGNATIDLWPYIFTAPADNEALELTAPKGVFRLSSNTFQQLSNRDGHFSFGFDAMEAI